ncbi:hypothetical protein Bbelb_088900 [Branchiostoma belcheri]|nr:hypothetical protein Bbelb_088900 [Branchiostoma belcheri]
MEANAVSTERDSINTPQQTNSSEKVDEATADIKAISSFSVTRGFTNAMYAGGSSQEAEHGDDPDSNVYNSIDEDDIENQQQPDADKEDGGQPTDEEKGTRLPSRVKKDACGMLNNPTYSSGAQVKDPSESSCFPPLLQSHLLVLRGFIIIVTATVGVAIGFGAVHLMGTIRQGNDGKLHSHLTGEESLSNSPAWTTSTSTVEPLANATAALPVVTTPLPGVTSTLSGGPPALTKVTETTDESTSPTMTNMETWMEPQDTDKQEMRVIKKETKVACWKRSLRLSCPVGEALSIDHANFGRTTTSIHCRCTTCDTNCRGATSLKVMKAACEGFQQCYVKAVTEVFGDPCPGTQKYLEATYHCVKVSPVTNDQLGTLVTKYAPKVWLAKGEKYNPSSIDFHLQHVKVYDGRMVYSSTPSTLPTCTEACYMSTAQPLPHAEAKLPFFRGERIGPTRQPPVYAVVKRVNSITTDIFYWMFFPYNLGKKVCVGVTIFGCIGKQRTLAHRVSDWEHMTIRLVGKNPSSIFVDSPEASAGIYNWDGASQTYRKGEDVVLTEGTHPILYSAYGHHKLWPSSGTQTFVALIKKLKDETSAGTAWDTWKNVRVTMYQPDGGYTGNWTWMNFKGRWGNKEVGCKLRVLTGQCTLNNGMVAITRMEQMKTDELD